MAVCMAMSSSEVVGKEKRDSPGSTVMEQALAQRLREVLRDLPPEDVYAIIAFAQFLLERRQGEKETTSQDELSEAEHTRGGRHDTFPRRDPPALW